MTSSRRTLLTVLLIVGAMATIVAIAALLRPYRYHGIVIDADRPVPDFELTAHTGRRVRLSDFRGKLVVLYFGYTYCPDVCPTSLSGLARAMKRLGPKADQVQVLMITVDPERDTPPTWVTSIRVLSGSPARRTKSQPQQRRSASITSDTRAHLPAATWWITPPR